MLRRHKDGTLTLLSSIIASQDEEHAKFGGVVPEIAARAHMNKIDSIIEQAIETSGVNYSDLSAVAATSGPGLIGGVIAGLMAANASFPRQRSRKFFFRWPKNRRCQSMGGQCEKPNRRA